MNRLRAEVESKQSARTKATLGAAIDAWMRVHEVAENTRQGYEQYARTHIKPAIGDVPVGKVTAKMLEQFYAELRRCRARCDGRPFIDHRVEGDHECRVLRHRRPPGRPKSKNTPPHDCAAAKCKVTECAPHVCRPLSASTIRHIHFAISAALSAAVRRDWITANPAIVAKKPRQPTPQPDPPNVEQASRIVTAAWGQDDGWGTLVWLVMVTGLRRAEVLALRWLHVDLAEGRLMIHRNYVIVAGKAVEKDTKTHQMRRISLEPRDAAHLVLSQAGSRRAVPPGRGDPPPCQHVLQARHRQPPARAAPLLRHRARHRGRRPAQQPVEVAAQVGC